MRGENQGRKGFQKGNTLWKLGAESKAEMKQRKIDVLLDVVAQGGVEQFTDLMSKLAQGVDINRAESQFLDRYEKLLPYMKPKLASVEQKVTVTSSPFGLGHEELAKLEATDIETL